MGQDEVTNERNRKQKKGNGQNTDDGRSKNGKRQGNDRERNQQDQNNGDDFRNERDRNRDDKGSKNGRRQGNDRERNQQDQNNKKGNEDDNYFNDDLDDQFGIDRERERNMDEVTNERNR